MRFGKAAWLYGTNLVLLTCVVIFLMAIGIMVSNPLFVLIPIHKYDPFVLGYCVVNICLAFFYVLSIVAIRKRLITLIIFCFRLTCFTIVVDVIMIFIFSDLMATAHYSLHSHIQVLHQTSKELCPVWDNAYQELSCCPPKEVLKTCGDFLNATKLFCRDDNSNACYIHIKKWLHSKTEVVGFLVFCFMPFVKLFMMMALRKDIEKVETEMAELEYYSQMQNDYDRHGDGYIESFKSTVNLAESTSTQSSRVSRVRSYPGYSPFLKHSVIEEVENEFTVRGGEMAEELRHAIAAHNARQLETTEQT